MKFIGKDNLIEILGKFESKTFSESTLQGILDWYGDSFEPNEEGNWERQMKNSNATELLGDKYSDIGNFIGKNRNEVD